MVNTTAKMQSLIMMSMAAADGNIDSDDHFHNDDYIMTADAVMMIPTIYFACDSCEMQTYVKV